MDQYNSNPGGQPCDNAQNQQNAYGQQGPTGQYGPESQYGPQGQYGGYDQYGQGPFVPREPKPDDHLVLAILCTACCCIPLGIVALVRSCQVDKYWRTGHYDLAVDAAADAKKWSLIGIGVTGVGFLLYVAVFFLLIIFS